MCYNFATFVLYLDVITLIYREDRLTSSETPLSAIKGVNQAFARFTPFFTPKNAIRTKLGSGNIPFIGYFVITTLIQTKYPQKISTNNYNKN